MKAELQTIQNKLYRFRGQLVMLDRDLAEMYGVETRALKQAVRRNIERFEGDDFMFELSVEETQEFSRSQFVTMNKGRGYNIKYKPFALTELGVAMLSSVLSSKTAIEINRSIMRAFVAMRQLVQNDSTDRVEELRKYVDEMFADQNDINEDTRLQMELINQTLAEMQVSNKGNNNPRPKIGFIKEE